MSADGAIRGYLGKSARKKNLHPFWSPDELRLEILLQKPKAPFLICDYLRESASKENLIRGICENPWAKKNLICGASAQICGQKRICGKIGLSLFGRFRFSRFLL